VQDINGNDEPRGNNPVRALDVPNSNFLNSLANHRHGLEVVGLLPTLKLVKLIANILLDVRWKFSNSL